MERIIVKTTFGPLTFTHDQKRVRVRGDIAAVADWQRRELDGLFGLYGHTFNPRNCFFSDLVYAVSSTFGENSFELTEKQKKLEKSEYNVPKNVCS